ncbi:MAG: cytochrome c [Candidatus Acidiferrales bacterium]
MDSDKNVDFSKRTSSVTGGVTALAIALAAVFAAYAGATARAAQTNAKPTRTTQDGVYTDDQAKEGKTQYSQNCAKCHLDDLSGSGEAQALAGDTFTQTWEGETVNDLFQVTYTTMPPDSPGSLTPEAALDVVAYLLQANQFPAGKDALKNDPEALKSIIITTKKTSQ